MPTRFQPIADEDMTADQRGMAEDAGAKSGPYLAYQRSPALWRAMQGPRQHFRAQPNFSKAEQELAIIVTARFWKSGFAFESHARLAREAGLPEAVIQAIAYDQRPVMAPPQVAIFDFCSALLRNGGVEDALFDAVRAHFTEQGVVDLTGIVGYYTTVSLLLNVDRQVAVEPLPF